MSNTETTVAAIESATNWNARIGLIRRVPEDFGLALLRDIYSLIAERVYVPHLAPDFAYIHPRPEYGLDPVAASLRSARAATDDFTRTTAADIEQALADHPNSMLAFRLIVAFTPQEMAAATLQMATKLGLPRANLNHVRRLESGQAVPEAARRVLAATVAGVVSGELFPPPPTGVQSKQDRPDLWDGWASVRALATGGVPYEMFLHQRHYGGAFRQLLDATSSKRGDVLESAVADLFVGAGVPFVQTGRANQSEIATRFRLTVQPAPDFVVYATDDTPRALLECKVVNDGGTARDKAARFAVLRQAGDRHGGIPVFAVIAGLGWRRTSDALGPVVQACDGRVFTLPTLPEMLTVDPFPALRVTALSP